MLLSLHLATFLSCCTSFQTLLTNPSRDFPPTEWHAWKESNNRRIGLYQCVLAGQQSSSLFGLQLLQAMFVAHLHTISQMHHFPGYHGEAIECIPGICPHTKLNSKYLNILLIPISQHWATATTCLGHQSNVIGLRQPVDLHLNVQGGGSLAATMLWQM